MRRFACGAAPWHPARSLAPFASAGAARELLVAPASVLHEPATEYLRKCAAKLRPAPSACQPGQLRARERPRASRPGTCPSSPPRPRTRTCRAARLPVRVPDEKDGFVAWLSKLGWDAAVIDMDAAEAAAAAGSGA